MKRGLVLTFAMMTTFWAFPVKGQNLLQQLQKRIEDAAAKKKAATPAVPPQTPSQTPAVPPQGAPGSAGFVADDHGKSEGIEILTIDAGGAAALANLKMGDRIVSVDGKLVKTLDDLGKTLAGRQAKSKIRLGVVRDGKLLEQTLTLHAAPDRLPAPRSSEPDPRSTLPVPSSNRAALLGVTADPLSEEYRRRYRVGATKGAVITSIVAGSPADRYRLPIGGVIVAVGSRQVNSPEDLRKAVASWPPNRDLEVTYYHQGQVFRRRLALAPSRQPLASGPATNSSDGRRFRGPVLQRLERVLDRVVERPQQEDGEVQLLRRQVDLLQTELERLRRRVDQLEQARRPATTKKQ